MGMATLISKLIVSEIRIRDGVSEVRRLWPIPRIYRTCVCVDLTAWEHKPLHMLVLNVSHVMISVCVCMCVHTCLNDTEASI